MKKIVVIALCLFSQFLFAESSKAKEAWSYLDNGKIRIGIDKSRGGCIGFLGESKTGRNLLNHFDEGRFIQQSYYGKSDGSDWNGKPWVYNPVQGGSWDRKPSRLLEFKKDDSKQSMYSKVEPRRWSSAKPCPEALMEQNISLHGNLAKINFIMNYTGPDQGKARHQEMPAVFVDALLKNFYYTKEGKLITEEPRVLKKKDGGLKLGKSSSEWVAYVDDNKWGVGVYTPGSTLFTCYKALGNGTTGPKGSACSYVSPLRTYSLTPGLKVDYTFYLTVGTLDEIKERFEALKKSK
ncbi:hypothetical protein LNTAR_06864 [Lentisphaera araneosa HTCC2155]|uniref:Uncharacterized protein n=1 Tax=Lentisphaera araneosa HTCC2155 TaxID=313628 RepID=A6DMQ8_9BACT|nr:hypothetical protein [Lentisphaera araneosa]EDM26944.1 hypothetical protein LNTAR_06864 [Lentisphaera araneosa HTCC2155]